MCSSISDNDWFQATLPFQFGDLGLRDSRHSAFLGSYNFTCFLGSYLVGSSVDSIQLAVEDCAFFFKTCGLPE